MRPCSMRSRSSPADEAPNPLPAKAVLRVLGLPQASAAFRWDLPRTGWSEGSLHARQLGLMAHEPLGPERSDGPACLKLSGSPSWAG